MSVQAMAWVLEKSESRLAARLVLLAIANHADSGGLNAWPSIRLIAAEARVTDRQAQRVIRELDKMGELIILAGQGPKGTNAYVLPHVTTAPRGDNLSPPNGNGCHPPGDKSSSVIRNNRPLTAQNLTPCKSPASGGQKIPTRKRDMLKIDQAVRAAKATHPTMTRAEAIQSAAAVLGFDPQYVVWSGQANKCPFHPTSGSTQWGTCWGCYQDGSAEPEPQTEEKSV